MTLIDRFWPLPPSEIPLRDTTVVLDELREKAKLPAGVSLSPTENPIGPVSPPWVIVLFGILLMVGRSLTELTVIWNDLEAVSEPSETVTVIVAAPDRLLAGET